MIYKAPRELKFGMYAKYELTNARSYIVSLYDNNYGTVNEKCKRLSAAGVPANNFLFARTLNVPKLWV